MASVAGMIGRGCGSSSWIQLKNSKKKKAMRKNDRVRVCTASYSASSAVTDPYKTLRIQPGASESQLDEHFSRPMKEFVSLCLKKAPSEVGKEKLEKQSILCSVWRRSSILSRGRVGSPSNCSLSSLLRYYIQVDPTQGGSGVFLSFSSISEWLSNPNNQTG
ncbi:hypothetical protein HYC85_023887 [Camellia sinensis]|uniref:Uncharacterized protein n=1 Tax=Camellia sinensis TaxID=4442 RepID=A0A7J7GJR7_CAMSI|nr:hypothetical protein HYC85_023887 [Camellia sinensis]